LKISLKTPPQYRRLATKHEILNCLKGFAAFWRFIIKSLTYVLKITAIALNTYFSAWVLLFVCSGYGGHPLSLYACLSCILICAVPPVTLITIALTFHKNLKILNSVLRIIAIILNAHLPESLPVLSLSKGMS
jgi:hypothetical protein